MGVEPPYLYDPPSRQRWSDTSDTFNPKSVTQASLARPMPRQKQEGPFLNFNKHPDSYLILPHGNPAVTNLGSNIKKKVKIARWAQQFFRSCQLVGAAGLLFCAICIRGIDTITGWIIRVMPGIVICHTVYAIYHLSRKPNGRTAHSSASYNLFAAALDIGLIPFFVFTALAGINQYKKQVNTPEMLWHTIFESDTTKESVIYAEFLLGVVDGGLYVVSLVISLYLAVLFRNIAKLPPDMNALEDNLTSRHKKKNFTIAQKHQSTASQISTTCSFAGPVDLKRNLQTQDPLLAAPRSLPFMHTRANSEDTFSSSNQPRFTNRNSRADLPSQINQNNSKRSSRVDLARAPAVSAVKRASQYEDLIQDSKQSKRGSYASLADANWHTTYTDSDSRADDENLARTESIVSSLKEQEVEMAKKYEALRQLYNDIPHPLEANPPTPPPWSAQGLGIGSPHKGATPKSKYYGDLKPGTPPIMGATITSPNRNNARVISNSGADFGGAARDVSGKVAEEGRGGGWARLRKISGI
ncbi:MAG: hypothetical protein M1829_002150 [Trizodia sp. TS-e1964]|nr:MAG: hypothetical protein M1829_002150 [Trizodia sp. TS-e1964]